MKERTIVEIFNESADRSRAEIADMEKSMAGKIRDQEKELTRIRGELERERTIRARLRAEYDGLDADIEAEVRAGLEAAEITQAKVQAGEVSLADYLKTGMSPEKLRDEARARVTEKLAAATKLLREKSARIYELEAAEASAVHNLAYFTNSTPILRLEKLKQELEGFQRAVNPIFGAYVAAANADEAAKRNLDHAQGKPISNIIWDSLTVPEIKELLFDARIPEDLIPQVEAFLATADPAMNFRGVYKGLADGAGRPYIQFAVMGPR